MKKYGTGGKPVAIPGQRRDEDAEQREATERDGEHDEQDDEPAVDPEP